MDCRIYNLRLGDAIRTGKAQKYVIRLEMTDGEGIVKATFDDGSDMWASKNTTLHVLDMERL